MQGVKELVDMYKFMLKISAVMFVVMFTIATVTIVHTDKEDTAVSAGRSDCGNLSKVFCTRGKTQWGEDTGS